MAQYIIRDPSTGAEITVSRPDQVKALLKRLPRLEDLDTLTPEIIKVKWAHVRKHLVEGRHTAAHSLLALLKRRGRRAVRSRDIMKALGMSDYRAFGRAVATAHRLAAAVGLPRNLLLFILKLRCKRTHQSGQPLCSVYLETCLRFLPK